MSNKKLSQFNGLSTLTEGTDFFPTFRSGVDNYYIGTANAGKALSVWNSSTTGVTAYAGGGQTNAILLNNRYNDVTTVATANDSTKLPTATVGRTSTVKNSGANQMVIYPPLGQSFEGLAINAGKTMAAGSILDFHCFTAGVWSEATIIASGQNMANANLTLTANRSHTLAGFTLGFTGGDVGFGTASPTAQIHVVGTNDLSGTYAAKIGGATTSGLQVRNDGKVGVGMGVNPFVAEFNAYSSTAGGLVGYLKNTNTGTSTFTRLQLDSADSVTGFILGQYGANYTFNANFTEGSSISAYRSNLMLTLWGGTYAQIKDIKFGIYEDGTNTYTELARLKKDGNFGIGVSPSYKCDVAGDINTTTVYRVGGVSGFTGTGAYANFTIVGGIITSAT